jgi:trans-2,3-dihydro-3-hydroxyanthranilate isomerase
MPKNFHDEDGFAEAAAAGSATGSLSGNLVHHGAIQTTEKIARFTVEQGDFMKRPSRISARVAEEKENIEKVKIGGSCVIVVKGEMFFI